MTRAPLPRRGYLGLQIDSDARTRHAAGKLVVSWVNASSPAARGGILVGDVLLAIDGDAVNDLASARRLAARLSPGREAELLICRDGRELSAPVNVETMAVEPFAQGRVLLDEVPWQANGAEAFRLRAIWTFPEKPGPHPAVWLIPSAAWVSSEHPLSTWHPTYRLIDALTAAGFATLRVDRSGLGDSEGPPCTELDLEAELGVWQAALEHFRNRTEVRSDALYLFGRSLGGVLAPLIARGEALGGIVAWGTSARTWHDSMLKSSARQYALGGLQRAEQQRKIERLGELQELIYLEQLTPAEAYARRPDLSDVQPEELAGDRVYGRTARFFHQLQRQDVAGAWREVTCPVLAVHADCDFLTEPDDLQHIAELAPHGRFLQLSGIDHFMHERSSLEEAFHRPWGGTFSTRAAATLAAFYGALAALD